MPRRLLPIAMLSFCVASAVLLATEVTTQRNQDSGITTIEVGAGAVPLVLLHGYASSPQEWLPFAETIRIGEQRRFVFPEGTEPVIRTDGAPAGRGWWKLADLSRSPPLGLRTTSSRVQVLLKEVERRLGSDPRATILGGFSQGAMISADIAFRTDEPMQALVLLSGTFVDETTWLRGMPRRKSLPVFISHGTQDEVLKFQVATRLAESMSRAGLDVTWMPFEGGHEMPAEVVTALNGFLLQVGAGKPSPPR
jgi:phospholipase/carboxylesterase